MSLVRAYVMVEVEYKFDIDEIKDWFGNHLTPVQVEDIAQELASYVILGGYDRGIIRIQKWCFGESFDDMVEHIREYYKE